MKGIILAGGSGTRLYPVTKPISKQIIPIYDKPMIYYPLSVLMLADIREILIISTERDIHLYQELLGDGQSIGLDLSYAIQKQPKGLAEAFIIGESFIGSDKVCLVLGDNVFYGHDFSKVLQEARHFHQGGIIFGYQVANPERYGVVVFDQDQKVISIEEKPQIPKSNYAVPGLYFYDNSVIGIAKNLKPSKRGELEITAVNNEYLKRNQLSVQIIGRGVAWLDTGTHDSLLDASNYVRAIQKRQGQYIACIEEIAYRMGFINKKELEDLADNYAASDYGCYLIRICNE